MEKETTKDDQNSIYKLLFKVLGSVSVSYSPRLHLFDQKYSQNSNVVKYYYNLK